MSKALVNRTRRSRIYSDKEKIEQAGRIITDVLRIMVTHDAKINQKPYLENPTLIIIPVNKNICPINGELCNYIEVWLDFIPEIYTDERAIKALLKTFIWMYEKHQRQESI